MSIGFKIKKLREEKRLSQPELAHILDVSQSTLSRIENSRLSKDIDFMLMDKVCSFFEVDFSYFLESGVVNNFETAENNNISCETGIINHFPERLFDTLCKNQEQISNQQEQIGKLMEMQNKLIEKLLSK